MVKKELIHGDCLEVMRGMAAASVDAVVTDPPYGLSFMGKKWDYDVPGEDVWRECLRVLKPGGHLLAFAGTRTQHRMAVRIEDAGFEIRDMIAWVYGSGFPKSLDVSKAIDKARNEDMQPASDVAKWLCNQMDERGVTRAQVSEHFNAANIAQQWTTHWTDGAVKPRVPKIEQWTELKAWLTLPDDMDAEVWRLNGRKGKPGDAFADREVVGNGKKPKPTFHTADIGGAAQANAYDITAPATEAAKQWDGWGSALKPALEPITMARKPLDGTIAGNVLKHGVGGINVDGCRVGTETITAHGGGKVGNRTYGMGKGIPPIEAGSNEHQGRWPANLIHDGGQEVLDLFPVTGGGSGKPRVEKTGDSTISKTGGLGIEGGRPIGFETAQYADSGSAARFFYCAKASKKDRDEGCEGISERFKKANGSHNGREDTDELSARWQRLARNHHPTVKPTDLMRYLCRLVTPPGGIVLDPFMGSGSTGKAALLEGFQFVGIERDADYLEIAKARIEAVSVLL